MTKGISEEEFVEIVFRALDDSMARWTALRRKGRLLLALPSGREAAALALGLYQPQRGLARAFVAIFGSAISAGMGRCMPTVRRESGSRAPLVPGVEPGTVGVMLGSPEHRIRRAIASYRAGPGWEVAKVAFGAEGRELLAGEAEVLSELAGRAPGVPACLGRVDGGDLHLLRLPRVRGRMLPAGHWEEAVTLLENWWVPGERVPASAFPEWPAIVEGLSGRDRRLLDRLSEFRLLPGVRHGDFARWNLIGSDDGGLTALDWEWGVARGMPGLDLVHFFAQDARLVHRQSPSEVIENTLSALRHPRCLALLGEAGWEDDVASVMLASLAHTFGSRQQDNGPVLEVLARRLESEPLSKTA